MLDRGSRSESSFSAARDSRADRGMRKKKLDSDRMILREEKNTPPAMRQSGLEENRKSHEYAKAEPIYLMEEFVELNITDMSKRNELRKAIEHRDITTIKNIFSEVAKKRPVFKEIVDKINNVFLGENPPWEYLDYFFSEEGIPRNFRTP